jgi:hypothetical protein
MYQWDHGYVAESWAWRLAFLDRHVKWKDEGICGFVSISFRDSKSLYMIICHDARLSDLKANLALKMLQDQIASASQLPEYQEALPYRETTLAGHLTRGATTLNGSETSSPSVSSKSNSEIEQLKNHANIDQISNDSPRYDSRWSKKDPWSRKIVLTLSMCAIDSETN